MKSDIQDTDDYLLIQGFLAGDEAQFSLLYNRYKLLLYNYLNNFLGNDRSSADDMFQQCWIKVIDQLPKYEHRQLFSAWLLRIAHNLVIDSFRKQGRLQKMEAGSIDDEESHIDVVGQHSEPWQRMQRNELETAIDHAVQKLSPELREVFLMRHDDIPFKEIARIQKCSINTVLARMQYALKKLRKELEEWKS